MVENIYICKVLGFSYFKLCILSTVALNKIYLIPVWSLIPDIWLGMCVAAVAAIRVRIPASCQTMYGTVHKVGINPETENGTLGTKRVFKKHIWLVCFSFRFISRLSKFNYFKCIQCCESKYVEFGSESVPRILAQFGSGSGSGSRV